MTEAKVVFEHVEIEENLCTSCTEINDCELILGFTHVSACVSFIQQENDND